MTLGEWNQLQAMIVTLWPNTKAPDIDALELSLPVVADVSFEDGQRAIVEASRRGDEWPPRPGQITRANSQTGEAVPWPVALQLIRQACGQFGRNREADGLRWLTTRSPHVARLAAESWREFCDAPIDGEYGGAIENRWRADYGQAVAQLDQEVAAGNVRQIVAQRVAQVERGGPSRGGLRQVHPAEHFAQLEPGEASA